MLNLTVVRKQSQRLEQHEMMHYIPLSELSYSELRADLQAGSHLAEIESLDLRGAGGVLIKCQCEADGWLAVHYLYKKYEEQLMQTIEPWQEAADDPEYSEDDADDACCDIDDDELHGHELETEDVERFLMKDGRMLRLPVIPEQEFVNHYAPFSPFGGGLYPIQNRWEEEVKSRRPYWTNGQYPLVIEGSGMSSHLRTAIERSQRFVLLMQANRMGAPYAAEQDAIHAFDKNFLFETNMEHCAVGRPDMSYYEEALSTIVKRQGCKLASSVDRGKLVKELLDYRGYLFQSTLDIDLLVQKAIRKKAGDAKTLKKSDFDKALLKPAAARKRSRGSSPSAAQELERMIGMQDVKEQLHRLVKRMKLVKLRREQGYKTSSMHLAACFLGNPGTNKTTTARLFGRMLCEANVLANDMFLEVGRKDLVGQYVGWTSPIIANLFQKVKGGTLFIDEAYSLASEGLKDGFSEEAVSEIIRQMENNPETLVIFAGYSDKMKDFIQHANPGLRSRLTNWIHFKDYGKSEMRDIFHYFLMQEDYAVQDGNGADQALDDFLTSIGRMQAANMGNGRLMRKLFHAAIARMAEREDNDLRTIMTQDIERAADEILQAEAALRRNGDDDRRIGFR